MSIYYTGIGCLETKEHTVYEFLKIMNKYFHDRYDNPVYKYKIKIGNRTKIIITSRTVLDWMNFVGASFTHKCMF
jgi:hypothetical protein